MSTSRENPKGKPSTRRIVALLRPFVRPHLGLVVLAIGLGALTSAAQAGVLALFIPLWRILFPTEQPEPGLATEVTPAESSDFLDRLFGDTAAWMQSLGGFEDPRMATLVAVSAIALIIAVIAALSQGGFSWFARRASYLMIVDLRVAVARHLMGLSLRYHERRQFGDLLSRISSDVTQILTAVTVGVRGMVLEPLMALGCLSYAFYIAPKPAVVALVTLPIAILPVSYFAKRVRKGSKRSLTSLGDSIQSLTQMFAGVRTVKSFGKEEKELEHYRELNSTYLATSMKMVRAIALTHGWTAFFSIAGVAALVFALGLVKVFFPGFLGPGGEMMSFLFAIGRASNHIKNVTKARTHVEEAIGAAERIQELFEEPADVVERPDARPIPSLGTGIRLEDVTFRYPEPDGEPAATRAALANVTLHIRPGETLALVGASGSGKSTLVDLLARFLDPTTGRITANGHDLRDLKLADWTSLYALVGQVPFLFHSSIGENIAYGRTGATQAEVEAAARAAHIHDFIASLPEGYATDASDMGSRLSGGQRQRITIARALLKGAPLLLLDEATSALDSESEAEVQRALDELMKDRTVVVIAHRLATIQNADRIAVLDDGRLVELGSHEELLARNGAYARLHSLQMLEPGPPAEAARVPQA